MSDINLAEQKFKRKLEIWLKAQDPKLIKVIKMPSGERFAVGCFECDSFVPSTWKILFDFSFNALKIVDVTGDDSMVYRFIGYTLTKTNSRTVAVFFADSPRMVCHFNAQKQFVCENVYRQIFVGFDDNQSMHFSMGLSNAPQKFPYYTKTIGSFPLKSLTKKCIDFVDENIESTQQLPLQNIEENHTDFADRDLNEKEILLLFNDCFA